MKIAVCIKQVPAVSMLRFDNETRRMVREGVPNEVNPYDVLGISLAARLKSEHDAEVVVVTMGPPQASEALVQGMAMGADYAIHLNDRAFAGFGHSGHGASIVHCAGAPGMRPHHLWA